MQHPSTHHAYEFLRYHVMGFATSKNVKMMLSGNMNHGNGVACTCVEAEMQNAICGTVMTVVQPSIPTAHTVVQSSQGNYHRNNNDDLFLPCIFETCGVILGSEGDGQQ